MMKIPLALSKKRFSSYEENEMSPFDIFALKELLQSFNSNNLTCLEIGSWFGAGSTQIIGQFSKDLVCIDHWQGNENDKHRNIVKEIDVFDRFVDNTSHFGKKIKPIRGSSKDVFPLLEKNMFDFIFIDGDHRYLSTVPDIKSSISLLKPGGIISGHDCEGRITPEIEKIINQKMNIDHIDSIYPNFRECHPGVIKAVSELIDEPNLYAEKRLNVENKNGYSSIWWKRL